MPERWVQELRKLEAIEPPDQLWRGVEDRSGGNADLGSRGPRSFGRRLALAMLALVVFIPAAIGAWLAFRPDASPEPNFATSPVQEGEIICQKNGTEVVTPRIAMQSDGSHFRVRNVGHRYFFLTRRIDGPDDAIGVGFGRPEKPLATFTLTIAPGRYLVGCFDAPLNIPALKASDFASVPIEIVDPHGIWPRYYDCGPRPTPPALERSGGAVTSSMAGEILFTRWIEVPGAGWESDIFSVRPDGSEIRPVLDGPTNDSDAVWSRDGSRIAFVRSTPDGEGNGIHVMNANGTGITNLTPTPGGITNDEPAWSPDGRHIAFRSNRKGLTIFVMRADGSDVRRLVDVEPAQRPNWSPDGGRILFSGRTDERHSCSESNLSVINPDGSGLQTLPGHPSAQSDPVFSPDGSKIAFGQGQGSEFDLFVMNADGSGLVRLTDYPGFDGRPVWSPDGKAIAFASDRGATAGQQDLNRENEATSQGISVYVISLETGAVSQVTGNELENAYPSSWR